MPLLCQFNRAWVLLRMLAYLSAVAHLAVGGTHSAPKLVPSEPHRVVSADASAVVTVAARIWISFEKPGLVAGIDMPTWVPMFLRRSNGIRRSPNQT